LTLWEVYVTWNWISGHTAILALVVAATAAALSLANTLLNRRYRRQDAYLKMHDLLTEPEMQRGRRLVYAIGRSGKIPDYDSDEHLAVNRTLAAHNNLAMYVSKGVISKRWVLDGWHHTLQDLGPGATAYINHRGDFHAWRVWTELEELIAEAASYKTSRLCCHAAERVAATGGRPDSTPPGDRSKVSG
jgi:hypothetical protein